MRQSGGFFTYQYQQLVLIVKGGTMVVFIIAVTVTVTVIVLDAWVLLKCRELSDNITKEYKDGKGA